MSSFNIVQYLKDKTFESLFENETIRKAVLNVLFGKWDDVMFNALKGGKQTRDEIRKFI